MAQGSSEPDTGRGMVNGATIQTIRPNLTAHVCEAKLGAQLTLRCLREFEDRRLFSPKLCAAKERYRLTSNLWNGVFCTLVEVCLWCDASRVRIRRKSTNLCIVFEVTSVRAGCRQVIDVSGHCSGELLQVV
jgi:hypothetical protein